MNKDAMPRAGQVFVEHPEDYEVETVTATLTKTRRGWEWIYEEEVHLAPGDAMENPPLSGKPGQKIQIRIIRGYHQIARGRRVEA